MADIKVKLIRPLLVGRHNRESGEVVTVPEARGQAMVKAGDAVLADPHAKGAPYSALTDDPGDISGKGGAEGPMDDIAREAREHTPDKATSKPQQHTHRAIKPH
jgi:hypothetical protein